MKYLKVIIFSVIFIISGIGVMHMLNETNITQTAGGGLFFIGVMMLSLALFNIISKKK